MVDKPGPRLVVRLGSLGDVVLSTAVAEAWRQQGTGPVDVLVKEEWAGVWLNHPAVRKVHAWSSRDRTWSGWRKLSEELRESGYVLAADLQASPRTRSLLAWADIMSVRPQRHSLKRRALVKTKHGGPPRKFRVVKSFLLAAAADPRTLPVVHPTPESLTLAGSLGIEGGIGLVPWARHATKEWPLERFVKLGQSVSSSGRPVVVFMDPGDPTQTERWRSLWPDESRWVGLSRPLEDVAGVLAALSGLVTGDTGLMHLAAAVGTPVVALFGPTVERFGFFPSGPGHQVLERPLDCRPCTVHGGPSCPETHFRCLRDITVTAVLQAVEKIPPKPVHGGPGSV